MRLHAPPCVPSRPACPGCLASVLEQGSSQAGNKLPGGSQHRLLFFQPSQDRVPAFSAEKAQAIIERELGAPTSVLFRSFNPRPIAAASLGQVGVGSAWVRLCGHKRWPPALTPAPSGSAQQHGRSLHETKYDAVRIPPLGWAAHGVYCGRACWGLEERRERR